MHTILVLDDFILTGWKGGRHFGFYIYRDHLYKRALDNLEPDVSIDQGYDLNSTECYLEVKMILIRWGYILDGE